MGPGTKRKAKKEKRSGSDKTEKNDSKNNESIIKRNKNTKGKYSGHGTYESWLLRETAIDMNFALMHKSHIKNKKKKT